jgi:hypothetical protein
VDTEDFAAFGAGPFFFFIPDEKPDPEFVYFLEILEHAHTVFRSVPLIQVFQPGAGETAAALGTVFGFASGDKIAVRDFTGQTVLGFRSLPPYDALAARAGVLFPDVSPAKAAVHSARGDQMGGYGFVHLPRFHGHDLVSFTDFFFSAAVLR